jgi:hypothetical protein
VVPGPSAARADAGRAGGGPVRLAGFMSTGRAESRELGETLGRREAQRRAEPKAVQEIAQPTGVDGHDTAPAATAAAQQKRAAAPPRGRHGRGPPPAPGSCASRPREILRVPYARRAVCARERKQGKPPSLPSCARVWTHSGFHTRRERVGPQRAWCVEAISCVVPHARSGRGRSGLAGSHRKGP